MRRLAMMLGMLIAGLLCGSEAAEAQTITASSGINILGTAPASLAEGSIENSTLITGFRERQNLVLNNNIGVDAIAPGSYATDPAGLTNGVLQSGERVNSFLLHADPVGTPPLTTFNGSITFGSRILGVIVTATHLNNSDSTVGSPTTFYPAVPDGPRGWETPNEDSFSISPDLRTVAVQLKTGSAIDQVRILTEVDSPVVPEPTAALLFLPAIGVVALARKKRSL